MQTNQNETFRTVIKSVHSNFDISHSQPILCMGSCFADRIGEQLRNYKFPVLVNPLGILFNPLSIAESLERLFSSNRIGEEELFFHEGCWNSYAFHSCFSHPNKHFCIQQIQQSLNETYSFIQHADFLIITLGSNVVYRLKDNGKVVANCHKMSANFFDKQALSVEEMEIPFESVLIKIRELRKNIRIILTVSPVRYIKNDFAENSYSKACLRILTHKLCQKYSWVSYFPSYEILMDDLRDYRFYAPDRVHPSEEAINYIWNYFSDTYFTNATLSLLHQLEDVRHAYSHRALFPQTNEFKNFCQDSLKKIRNIQILHPTLDFSEECAYFEQFIECK